MNTPEQPLNLEQKCVAIVKRMIELQNEKGHVTFENDFGNWTTTIIAGDRHTHCGIPGKDGSFELLVDNIYNSLHGGPGLSWE